MMPNIDPKALKQMMDRMGMKAREIGAERVVIEGKERDIIIENPSVTLIEMQGNNTFQIVGNYREVEKGKVEVTDDDIMMVMERSGVEDREKAKLALEEANGDIAEAIMKLKGEG